MFSGLKLRAGDLPKGDNNVSKAVPAVTTEAKPSPDFQIECQFRPSLDRSRYPILQVFLTNRSSLPVEWAKVFLNGKEAGLRVNGCAYFQFYPSAKTQPGETVELQLGLENIPTTPQRVDVETKTGQRVSASLDRLIFASKRIRGITFSDDYGTLFLSYSSEEVAQAPSNLWVNGIDCTERMAVLEKPKANEPGLIRVALPTPTAPGRAVHVRLAFGGEQTGGGGLPSKVIQNIVRAHHGISIDCFGIGTSAKDQPLRRELNLSERPFVVIGADPACDDIGRGGFYGKAMPAVLKQRQALQRSQPERLNYLYLCTAAGNNAWSEYGFCADATVANPYCLHWDTAARFIEEEERSFRSAYEAAGPHPWGWIPETFILLPNRRVLEPQELRLLSFAALGFGIQVFHYYIYRGSSVNECGFEKSAPLLAEVKRLNADLRKLEPLFATALPLSREIVGDRQTGLCVNRLWSGETASLLVIARNLDYVTDRQPNDGGNPPRFHSKPKENVRLQIRQPSWLTPAQAADALTGEPIPLRVQAGMIELDLGRIELGKIVVISNAKAKSTTGVHPKESAAADDRTSKESPQS